MLTLYLGLSVSFTFLPVLLPWSLDTVFVTSIMIYLGYRLQDKTSEVEKFQIKSLKNIKTFIVLSIIGVLYLVVCYLGRGINTSIRLWGHSGTVNITTYIMAGFLGTLIYLLLFSALEKEGWGKPIVSFFAYLGKRTITLLATHFMIFRLLDTAFYPEIFAGCSYGMSLVMVLIALVLGVVLSNVFAYFGRKVALFRLL